jgi:PBP4 family serine-type D-alanyl-D-alanine carboxypeptidase
MINLIIFGFFAIDSILSNSPELQNAYYGLCFYDLKGERVIYEVNSNKLFTPASNMKIITTATALYFLGRDFHFKTYLHILGTIRENRLYGDIILQGGGDPCLSLDAIERLVNIIKSLNIKEVTGGIMIVDDYFTEERLPIGWSWHYLDAKYAPEISALSLNKNVVSVRIRPTSEGEYANVYIYPQTNYVKLISRIKTSSNSETLIIYRKPEENTIIVDGKINIKNPRDIDIAVKDPGLFTGEYFKERLNASGIKVEKSVERIRSYEMFIKQAQPRVIDSLLSPALIEIIKETNTESENLFAEILLKTLGAQKYKEGSFNAGINALKNFLYICGVDTENVSIWDGSGLSKNNLISPSTLIAVLKFMYNSVLYSDYYSTLPEPGKGTLKARFNGFTDTIRAKTGAIQSVSCLSGYLRIDGKDYAFSMLFNNFTCPTKRILPIQERIIRAFVKEIRKNNSVENSKFLSPVEIMTND